MKTAQRHVADVPAISLRVPAQPGVGGHRRDPAGALPRALRAAAEVARPRRPVSRPAARTTCSCPGLLIQLGLFGASGVGFGLIAELRAGVIERFRVTPVSRFALLLGRALRDILTLVVQSLILLLLAIPFGLQADRVGVFVMLGLVALIGLGMSSLAYAAALALKSEDSVRAAHLHALAAAAPAQRRAAPARSSHRSGCSTSRRRIRSPTR